MLRLSSPFRGFREVFRLQEQHRILEASRIGASAAAPTPTAPPCQVQLEKVLSNARLQGGRGQEGGERGAGRRAQQCAR